ncbi:MAG: cation diffusion facilitator family transporter [Desulfurella sp.]|uniref:cation diffusion facilitator family transporter n=2 Tax=Desulfurella sp. TaxID=1962857 RepID=UPI00177A6D49|nr:cation diffusion facilitator family transporter [Desulfurella sp.]HEX13910.1 cation diffusion facilitator family transporter [Desulfurella acetivorans]
MNQANVDYKKESKKVINKLLIASTFINLALTIIKYVLGKWIGNVALQADALHSSLDVLSSVIVFSAMFFSYIKSEKFPFGLYKLENIASSFVSLLIILTAFEIGYSLFEKREPVHTSVLNQIIVAIVLFFIVILMYLYSKYEKKIGTQYSSSGLVSDAEHIKSDLFSIFIIICSIIFSIFGLNIDKYVAIVIVVMILHSGFELLKNSTLALLDINVDKKTIEAIKQEISQFEHVNEITSIKGRKSGRFMLLEIIVKLDIASFEEAHKLSSQIEQRIYEKFPNVDNVIVHYEPIEKKIVKICIPQTKNEQISEDFSNSSSFLIIDYDLSRKKILNKQQKPNDFLELKEKKGIQIALYLVKEGVDIIVTTKHIENTGPYFVFKTHNKKFYVVENVQIDNLEELLKSISNKIYVKQTGEET